jgi:hypothetical protein
MLSRSTALYPRLDYNLLHPGIVAVNLALPFINARPSGDFGRVVGNPEVGIGSLFTSGLPVTLNFSVASGQGIYAWKVRIHARMCQEKPLRPTGIQAQCGST